jgi:hypothetical protein
MAPHSLQPSVQPTTQSLADAAFAKQALADSAKHQAERKRILVIL